MIGFDNKCQCAHEYHSIEIRYQAPGIFKHQQARLKSVDRLYSIQIINYITRFFKHLRIYLIIIKFKNVKSIFNVKIIK